MIPSRGALRVLFVEDSEDDAYLIVRHLERSGFALEHFRVDTHDSFVNALANAAWDVVVCDHSMPHFSSREASLSCRRASWSVPSSSCRARSARMQPSRPCARARTITSSRTTSRGWRRPSTVSSRTPSCDGRRARNARLGGRSNASCSRRRRWRPLAGSPGGIAHDFNNLLTAILGFTNLALERLETKRDVRFEIDQVKQAGERAARFTRQLLAFSRQQVLSPRLIDPAETVESMAPMLKHLLGEAVQLETAGASGQGRIKVDPGQFEQVVMNLAINARDAMPHGGTLRLETSRADIEGREATALQLAPGPYVTVIGRRFGHGHGRQHPRPDLRTIFHDQAAGPGYRTRAVDGVRHPAAERRQHCRRIGH